MSPREIVTHLTSLHREQQRSRTRQGYILVQLLNKYYKMKRDDIESCAMGPDNFNALFKVYVENNWQGMDCYNSFIKGFGAEFDSFNSN